MLQQPAFVLSILLASAYAALFQLWKGRTLKDLVFFWLAALVGFGSGQLIGQRLDLIQTAIGQIRVIEATLFAFLFLAVARWLTRKPELP